MHFAEVGEFPDETQTPDVEDPVCLEVSIVFSLTDEEKEGTTIFRITVALSSTFFFKTLRKRGIQMVCSTRLGESIWGCPDGKENKISSLACFLMWRIGLLQGTPISL